MVSQIVVDYLHTPHHELNGLTPHDKWLAGLKLMTPVPPPLTPQLERAFWRLEPRARVATARGLGAFGLHYWDVGLDNLRHPDRQGRRRHFSLRYDPADVSRVAVFEDGLWLGDGYAGELRLPDGRYEPASLWELELAKDLARSRGQPRASRPHSWLIHLLETKALIEQRQEEQKLIRRKVQQLRERRQGRPIAAQRQAVEAAQLQKTQAVMAEHSERQDDRGHPSAGSGQALVDARARLLSNLTEVL